MSGKHDRAGGDPPTGLLSTGPIVVRGVSRGVKDALRSGPGSRHRASRTSGGAGSEEGAPSDSAEETDGASPGAAQAQPVDVPGARSSSAGQDASDAVDTAGADEQGEQDVARSEDPPGGTGPEESSEPDSRTPLEDLLESAPEPPRPRRRTRVPLRLRREVLGVALVAVLAVVCAGLIVAVALKTRNDTALAAREAASYTPPPLTGSSPAGATGPAIAIISDETATRAASGVGASDRWPRLLRTALEARVTTIASTGAGFVSEGANGRTFEDAASDVPTDADTVLFVGGSADASSTSIAVASAATRAIAAAEQRAPDAKIIVVGPLYAPASATAEQTTALRAALRSSARVAEVPWVDPVDSNWLGNVDTTGALTAAAERTVTSRLRTVISSAPSR